MTPRPLDPAILKRPGRFDRLAAFRSPTIELRRCYLDRLTNRSLDEQSIAAAAQEADRMSFAQIREAYILAGQRSFRKGGRFQLEELADAIRIVRSEANGVGSRADGRLLGFGSAPHGDRPSAVCRRS